FFHFITILLIGYPTFVPSKNQVYSSMNFKIIWVSILAAFASSCVSNEKLIYLQNLEGMPAIPEDTMINYAFTEYRLQFNDIVDVQIQTSDEGMNELFNVR